MKYYCLKIVYKKGFNILTEYVKYIGLFNDSNIVICSTVFGNCDIFMNERDLISVQYYTLKIDVENKSVKFKQLISSLN